ncbi:MAG: helix-turn-helix domain-containing protein [Candidatus Diapherotrites archaeon]
MQEFGKIEVFCSKKFNLSVVRALLLSGKGVSFNTLLKTLQPITPRVLSQRLKELEQLGLVQKNLVLGQKPKIEYLATSKAEGLRKAIKELEKWGNSTLN